MGEMTPAQSQELICRSVTAPPLPLTVLDHLPEEAPGRSDGGAFGPVGEGDAREGAGFPPSSSELNALRGGGNPRLRMLFARSVGLRGIQGQLYIVSLTNTTAGKGGKCSGWAESGASLGSLLLKV